MEKTYQPANIEQKWYRHWKDSGYFAPGGGGNPPYCIMIPPPNVTGTLHMGHAFNNTLMDCLTRYHRMAGFNTLWQPGTDHAGIATQMVVERQLNAKGETRHDLGREKFVEKIWEWKEHSGQTISRQLERMGSSLDWSRERFTMDDSLSEAVKTVFVRLYDEGLIYRGKRLVNWDPVLHTAVSDLEVISEEEDGHMWHIRYPHADGDGHVTVATTRPETLLGDSAVAVHPNDERYRALVGKTLKLPLTDREIPVIADEYVDPEFGSGCVKITPAHDFNDYEVGLRHDLEQINIFTDDARLNDNAPPAYRDMDRFEARKKIIEDLKAQGLLAEIRKHRHVIPRGDRSGAIVEPYLTRQWYVSVQALAEPAIEAVKDGSIEFVPGNWSKTYFEWMHNLQDWCISRQLWWGHRIPAWYDSEGTVYVGRDEAQVRQKYGLDPEQALTQDEDVLDTWFSSALWPFSTLGWPEKSDALETFYPTSVLITGFDIIFFWVARMVMMGLKFMDDVPFRKVYVHGLVRDANGQKMSKSKGNVLDPIDIIDGIDLEALVQKRTRGLMQPDMAPAIEKTTRREYPNGIKAHGTDALRFSFAAQASFGRDIKFHLSRIEGYRNFCNKLWNAARFTLMITENQDIATHVDSRHTTLADRWILDRQRDVIDLTHKYLSGYRFDLAAQTLYDFVWHELCDWYIELCKPTLFRDDAPEDIKQNTRRVLLEVLDTSLRLLHPVIPFVTEEIWQLIAQRMRIDGESIMLQPFPCSDPQHVDTASLEKMEWAKELVNAVRKVRSDMDVPPGKRLSVLIQNGSSQDQAYFEDTRAYIHELAMLEDVRWLQDETPPESATALAGQMKILIPLAGLINKDAECARLKKEIGKLESGLGKLKSKLDNPNFKDKAPAAIVEQEVARFDATQASLQQLREQLAKIQAS
ncbi:MAG: valine--tRNA ligase [Proteobacteria bacterium]|nr:valine--tRNA ligase [Pseudomonadota bacterium]